MTEKEISEKVWDFIDEWERAGDVGLVAGYKKDGYVMAFNRIRMELPEILPRPKKKVKKTREVWLLVGFNKSLNTLRTDGNIYSTREEAEEAREEWEIIQRVDISMEVEE